MQRPSRAWFIRHWAAAPMVARGFETAPYPRLLQLRSHVLVEFSICASLVRAFTRSGPSPSAPGRRSVTNRRVGGAVGSTDEPVALGSAR